MSIGTLKNAPRAVQITPLTQVQEMVSEILSRAWNEHPFGLVTGPVGIGKTRSTLELESLLITQGLQYARIECYPGMTMKDLLHSLLGEGGYAVKDSMGRLRERFLRHRRGTMVIIDEAHHLLDGRREERLTHLRMLGDAVQSGMVFVGEPVLGQAINERGTLATLRDRIHRWVELAPLSLADVQRLAVAVCRAELTTDMQEYLLEETGGVTRRLITAMQRVSEWRENAANADVREVSLAVWQKRNPRAELFRGHQPGRVGR